jgi:hypothetical protein
MPRATVADRAVYQAWETQARAELDRCEPEHAVKERLTHYEDDGSWRSLPDYDGPPMRAPSGVGWWRFDAPGEPLSVPIEAVIRASIERWVTHIRGLAYSTAPDDGRKDEHGVIRYASWYMENFGGTRMITDCFDLPSKGGRGWCPKLAGVAT